MELKNCQKRVQFWKWKWSNLKSFHFSGRNSDIMNLSLFLLSCTYFEHVCFSRQRTDFVAIIYMYWGVPAKQWPLVLWIWILVHVPCSVLHYLSVQQTVYLKRHCLNENIFRDDHACVYTNNLWNKLLGKQATFLGHHGTMIICLNNCHGPENCPALKSI